MLRQLQSYYKNRKEHIESGQFYLQKSKKTVMNSMSFNSHLLQIIKHFQNLVAPKHERIEVINFIWSGITVSCAVIRSGITVSCAVIRSGITVSCAVIRSGITVSCAVIRSGIIVSCAVIRSGITVSCAVIRSGIIVSCAVANNLL